MFDVLYDGLLVFWMGQTGWHAGYMDVGKGAHWGPCSWAYRHMVHWCAWILVVVVIGRLSHVGVLVLVPQGGHIRGCWRQHSLAGREWHCMRNARNHNLLCSTCFEK